MVINIMFTVVHLHVSFLYAGMDVIGVQNGQVELGCDGYKGSYPHSQEHLESRLHAIPPKNIKNH